MSADELARARQGKSLIAAAISEVQAPQSLREAIERERERAQAPSRPSLWRRRGRALIGAAVASAAIGAAVVAFSPTGNHGQPSLARVEHAAQLGAAQPAPRVEGGDPPVLDVRVGALAFPDWRQSFGWKAVGARHDSISGREVTTVLYRNPDGARLGYSVVGGPPLGEHPAGRAVTRAGKAYRVAGAGEHTLVTWTQQGHTCVIVASSSVPEGRLVDLAASRNS